MQGNVTPPNSPCSTLITIITLTDLPSHGVSNDKIAGTPTPIPKICSGEYSLSYVVLLGSFMELELQLLIYENHNKLTKIDHRYKYTPSFHRNA